MKITQKEIDKLAKVLEDNNLSSIEYSEDGYQIKLCKEPLSTTNAVNNITDIGVNNTKDNKIINQQDSTVEIKCPLIGHFYLTKTPVDSPYVKVGDVIEKGDVIGILEAMKVSNEIKSEVKGEIVEILVESGQFVDYDHVLMKVKEI